MQASSVFSHSPSFNSYSSSPNLAQIADRVVQEFRAESKSQFDDEDDFGFKYHKSLNKIDEPREEDEEFEFAFVNSSPISADEIFCNGQIRPVYPVFNTDLLLDNENSVSVPAKPLRLPLRKLFFEERETPSCSSSESDELDRIPAGTYCVWAPKTAKAAEEDLAEKCKKSNSTGSSKRWKFRDLLHRSNSEGKDTFVFLTPASSNWRKREEKVGKVVSKVAAEQKGNGSAAVEGGVSAAEVAARNDRNKAMKDGDRRRSYLPYRQDLVGFFANVNGVSKNIRPF